MSFSGGVGQDSLVGGAGRDLFSFNETLSNFLFANAYNDTGETSVGAPDIIYGFDAPGNALGDKIDLRRIDAKPGMGGDDAFVFGQVVNIPEGGVIGIILQDEGTYTAIYGYQVRNQASFKILIDDGAWVYASNYTAEDFLL